jgi:BioD-like phosphotransacetylase family protein
VVSAEEAAGKTAICAGLGRYFMGNGQKVGYLKLAGAEKGGTDSDAAFIKQVLNLSEDAASLCLPADDAKKVKKAYQKVSEDRDAVIVEGRLGRGADDDASYAIARALGARVIVVEAYAEPPFNFIEVYKGFGDGLLGVVLNKVPKSQLSRVSAEAAKRFGAAGINVLGVMPEDRTLLALTVGELADCLQGKILNSAEKSAELVESYMLGAMVVDSGLSYFGRKSHKAAVVRGDRPDMQLAALETSTSCLVLSDSRQPPFYNVMEKAENRGIPIIATQSQATDIVVGIEAALERSRFAEEKKLPVLAELLKQHLNLKAVLTIAS